MRQPFITAQLPRQVPAAIGAEPGKRPARDAAPGRRVRRLVCSAATLLVAALVALSVPLPAGAAHARPPDGRAGQAALSWKDDYGTRHHLVPVRDPVLGWHDFLGTRQTQGLPKAPTLSWRDDYGTRHPDERP